MVLNKPLLQEENVQNELILIETIQTGSRNRWTAIPANNGFEIDPWDTSGRRDFLSIQVGDFTFHYNKGENVSSRA